MNLISKDKEYRHRIEKEVDKNFFVEASAGSGKTTSLISRMIAMVRSGIKTQEICAITYTKAAAKEFYIRFQARLDEESRNEENSEEQRKLFEEALINIDLCFMGTIDAFSNMLLSEYPFDAGIPMNTSVLSEGELLKAYMREWNRAIKGEYDKEFTKAYNALLAWEVRPDRKLAKKIDDIMDDREGTLIFDEPSFKNPDEVWGETKKELYDLAKYFVDNPQILDDKSGSNSAMEELIKKYPLFLKKWTGNMKAIKKLIDTLGNVRVKAEDYVEYFELSKMRGNYGYKVKDKVPYYDIMLNNEKLLRVNAISKFVDAVSPVLKSNGEMYFYDYLLYLRDMLKKDVENGGKIISHISKKHKYFLLDEFQDTKPIQTEIFFYLAAEKLDSNWQKCIPRSGSLFIVGDPKQSIYRFSGADVVAFMKVRSLFKGDVGEVLYLYQNFRSKKVLKDWFNDKFKELMSETSTYQSKYDEIPYEDIEDNTEVFEGIYQYGSSKEEDSVKVANIVQNLVIGEEKIIGKDKAIRNISYGDIMVITYNKKELKEYSKEFLTRGIPFRVSGKTRFVDCKTLVAIANIIDSFVDYDCFLPKYKVLNEIFNISNEEIFKYKNGIEISEHLSEIINKLDLLKEEVQNYSPTVIFEKISERLNIIDNVENVEISYYYFALELLRSAEKDGVVLEMKDMADFFEGLFNDNEEREMLLEKADNSVQLANLHKVKGLEASVVILGSPKTKKDPPGTEWKIERENGEVKRYYYLSKEMKEEENKHKEAEKIRLKYVAATRARNALIISSIDMIDDMTEKEKGALQNSRRWKEFIDNQIKTIDAEREVEEREVNTETVNRDEIISKVKENISVLKELQDSKSYELIRPSTRAKSKVSEDDWYEDMIGEELEESIKGENDALIGTLVHRMMELLVNAKGNVDTKELIDFVIEEYNLFGEFEEMCRKKLVETVEKIKNGGCLQRNGMADDILSVIKNSDEVMTEVPFCMFKDGKIINGIIDLVYLYEGEWYIVDYKTSFERNHLEEKYEEQLRWYGEALEGSVGSNAKTYVYHIDV